MAEIVRAIDTETGNVVNLDLTPQWSKENATDSKEQQAILEGNAKFIPDQRPKGKPCAEIPAGFAPPRGWNGCSHGFFAPHLVWPKQDLPPEAPKPAPVKRGRGRPKGSKNKVKIVEDVRDPAIPGATPAERVENYRASLADTPGPAVEVVDPAKLAAVIKALKDEGLV